MVHVAQPAGWIGFHLIVHVGRVVAALGVARECARWKLSELLGAKMSLRLGAACFTGGLEINSRLSDGAGLGQGGDCKGGKWPAAMQVLIDAAIIRLRVVLGFPELAQRELYM